MHSLTASDNEHKKLSKRLISLYARRNNAYVIVLSRDKFKRACEIAKRRIRQEKMDFLKSIEMFNKFSRNSMKNMIKMLTKRSINKA